MDVATALFSLFVCLAAVAGLKTTSSESKWTPTLNGVAKLQRVAWAVPDVVAEKMLPQILDTPAMVVEVAGDVCRAAISR